MKMYLSIAKYWCCLLGLVLICSLCCIREAEARIIAQQSPEPTITPGHPTPAPSEPVPTDPTPFPITWLPSVTPGSPTSTPTITQPSKLPSYSPSYPPTTTSPSASPSDIPTFAPSSAPTSAPSLSTTTISLQPVDVTAPHNSHTTAPLVTNVATEPPSSFPTGLGLPLQEMTLFGIKMIIGNTSLMSHASVEKWENITAHQIRNEVEATHKTQTQISHPDSSNAVLFSTRVVLVMRSQTPALVQSSEISSEVVQETQNLGGTRRRQLSTFSSKGNGKDDGVRRLLLQQEEDSVSQLEILFDLDIFVQSHQIVNDDIGTYILGAFDSAEDKEDYKTALKVMDPHFYSTSFIQVILPQTSPRSPHTDTIIANKNTNNRSVIITVLVLGGIGVIALIGTTVSYFRTRKPDIWKVPDYFSRTS